MSDLSIIQIILLSLIQALTEFLPISSSAHLLLPSKLLGWPDQGILFDITVHFATLLAVLLYFKKDFIKISFYKSKIFQMLILATLPLVILVIFVDDLGSYRWSLSTIAISNIFFAILLLLSERFSAQTHENSTMKYSHALIIGIFQMFSVISGASRSGTAITGSLFLGYKREDAAKFSLLLAIPTILGALIFSLADYRILKEDIHILTTFIGFLTTFIVSYLSISIFLKLVKAVGFLPFIIYRILLGILLLCLI